MIMYLHLNIDLVCQNEQNEPTSIWRPTNMGPVNETNIMERLNEPLLT